MILFKKGTDLHKYLDTQRKNGVKIGFVPTMGALHMGHISLIKEAGEHGQLVVCSIFVNPTQFNDPADYMKYPVTINKDIEMLEASGCDVLFLPSVGEIYPNGTDEKIHYELGYLETIMEGKYRPGHFQGVCRVVHRLLTLVTTDHLYIGQKDYQQCLVIKKLLELTSMDNAIKVHISPTLREKDGLAMSSRNMRLDTNARQLATSIYQALTMVKKNIQPGDLDLLKKQAVVSLNEKGIKTDYVEIADAKTLLPVPNWDGKQKLVSLAAAFMGEVRLIDNILLN